MSTLWWWHWLVTQVQGPYGPLRYFLVHHLHYGPLRYFGR